MDLKSLREGITPGPWRAVKAHHGPVDIFDGNGRDIVTVYGGGVSSSERLPNARLIAAAPDLLDLAETQADALTTATARAEALAAEVERLRGALEQNAAEISIVVKSKGRRLDWEYMYSQWRKVACDRADAARAALRGDANGK